MDRHVFDSAVRELYAAFGKTEPRLAVLDAAFKPVAGLEDGFVAWACDSLAEGEKLPANLGRELKRMYPAYLAENYSGPALDGFESDASGDPECPDCRGKGWHYVWRRNAKPGTAPTAIPCRCNRVVDCWPDLHLRRASLEDLRRAGIWTFHEPPMARNRPPQPMKSSLRGVLARIRAGRGIPEGDAYDPRRELPQELS